MRQIIKIISFTRELWPYYVAVSVFSIIIAGINLLQPYLSGLAIDEIQIVDEANLNRIILIVVAIFVLDLLSTLFSNIGGYIGDLMRVRVQKILSTRYYKHILNLSQQYFDTELSGKVINRLNRSIAQISNFMHMWSNNFLQFLFNTVLSLGVIAFFSIEIALLLFLLYPIYIFMTVKTSKKWMKYAEKINHYWDIATGRFTEAIGQVKVVKSFLQEKHELGFFERQYKRMVKLTTPQSKLWHKRDTQRRLVLNVIFFGVYLLIFVQAAQGVFTAGEAVMLLLYAMQIRIPIFTISFLVENTQRAVADSKDYFEIMNQSPSIIDRSPSKKLIVKNGKIQFKNVSFGYEKNQTILNNINCSIKPNTKVALVGESGEGKTTFTNLILRLYEPRSGEVLIDGQNISNLSIKSLRKNIGVVFQDPMLFSGTIKENIAYSKPNTKTSEIIKSAKAANAHNFIKGFPNGYDTQIGERGLKLSGGQKQRIAIARAFLKDAPILILDEATSSLDSKSEQLVQQALKTLMKNRTTIIIAHRLSTIKHVDQIITLKNGTIEETGTPKELAKSGGIYEKLLELQSSKPSKYKLKFKEFELNE